MQRLAGVVRIPRLSQRVYINKREAKVGDGSLENERLELNKERGGKGKGGARYQNVRRVNSVLFSMFDRKKK